MKNIITIIKKQLLDTFKNKAVLIQFVMFPMMAVIMTNAVKMDGMPDNFFVTLFATMYIGMAPLVSVSSIIAEEKEKNTLRVLMMAKVTPAQYLLGVGTYVFGICMVGSLVFTALLKNVDLNYRLGFLAVMAAGFLISIFMGATIGVAGRNQMAASSVAIPVMMIFSFLPMIASFNKTVEKVAVVAYSEQIRRLFANLGQNENVTKGFLILAINMVIFAALFAVLYRKKGLE